MLAHKRVEQAFLAVLRRHHPGRRWIIDREHERPEPGTAAARQIRGPVTGPADEETILERGTAA